MNKRKEKKKTDGVFSFFFSFFFPVQIQFCFFKYKLLDQC